MPPPPPPGPPSGGLQSVGPWPRFGARIIDWLVLLIPNLIIGAIIGGGGTPVGMAGGGRAWFAGVIGTLIGFGYFVYLESSRGQTIGKQVLNIKTIGPDGNVPSTDVALRRNAWLLLSIVPILGGLAQFVLAIVIAVTINSDPFNRGWHDNFAGGSAVVRTN